MTPTTRAAILGITAILIGLPLSGWTHFVLRMVPDGHADFRTNYTAGYMLRTGKPLYDYALEIESQNLKVSPEAIALPFIHPAYEALLYVPLSFLSYLEAYWIWFAVNLIVVVFVYRLLRPELSALSAAAPWLPAGTLAAFLPIGAAIVQGQDSLLVLLLMAMAFAHFRYSEGFVAAGAFLGLAVFRFHIVLPVALCFFFWRRWKIVFGFSISALGAAALSIALAGFWPYVHRLLGLSLQPEDAYAPAIPRMPTLRGLIHSLGGSDWLVLGASVGLLAVTVLVGRGCRLPQQFSLAITTTALVSYHAFVHDLSVLLIPIALLISWKQDSALLIIGICFFTPTLLAFAPDYSYFGVLPVLLLFIFLAIAMRRSQRMSTLEPVSPF